MRPSWPVTSARVKLTPIHVPDEATEAVRDLERARDDAKRSERVARHHLSQVSVASGSHLHRRDQVGRPHMGWVAGQTFEHPASQHVFSDYREAVELATARVERLTLRLREVAYAWDRAPLIKALQVLRGVEMVSSVTLVAEIADFRRFASASALMSYVGLVPSENSSGSSRRLGESREPATATCVAFWSSRPGSINVCQGCPRPCGRGMRESSPRCVPSPGRPNTGCIRGSGSC